MHWEGVMSLQGQNYLTSNFFKMLQLNTNIQSGLNCYLYCSVFTFFLNN